MHAGPRSMVESLIQREIWGKYQSRLLFTQMYKGIGGRFGLGLSLQG